MQQKFEHLETKWLLKFNQGEAESQNNEAGTSLGERGRVGMLLQASRALGPALKEAELDYPQRLD